MYEIWLVLNIVWEIALGLWPLLLAAGLLLAVLVVVAVRQPAAGWRRALPGTLLVAVVVALAAVLLVPGWVQSSLADLAYWVDWANLLALAAAAGAVAAAFAWPLLALRKAAR